MRSHPKVNSGLVYWIVIDYDIPQTVMVTAVGCTHVCQYHDKY